MFMIDPKSCNKINPSNLDVFLSMFVCTLQCRSYLSLFIWKCYKVYSSNTGVKEEDNDKKSS